MTNAIIYPPVGTYHNTAIVPVGTTAKDQESREYIFVKLADAVTYVGGAVLTWKTPSTFIATNDESAGNDVPAGVLPAFKRTATQVVPTQDQFGWIQTWGPHPAVAKEAAVDSFASGNAVIVDPSVDGRADKAGTVGEATAADRARLIGRATDVSEDTATGTWNEDTVPVFLTIVRG